MKLKVQDSNSPVYILSEGVSDASRLDLQNEIYQHCLKNALRKASSLKDLEGAIFIDFGSGSASAYKYIKPFIGNNGIYIGIDKSKLQIENAKNSHPHLTFIEGDENSEEVLSEISKADVIFMRFVIMHHKNPQKIISKIFDNMKESAIFIIQDPQTTKKQIDEMEKKYPTSEKLVGFKNIIGEKRGLDYNISGKLDGFFKELKTKKYSHIIDDNLYIPMSIAKELYFNTFVNISKI